MLPSRGHVWICIASLLSNFICKEKQRIKSNHLVDKYWHLVHKLRMHCQHLRYNNFMEECWLQMDK